MGSRAGAKGESGLIVKMRRVVLRTEGMMGWEWKCSWERCWRKSRCSGSLNAGDDAGEGDGDGRSEVDCAESPQQNHLLGRVACSFQHWDDHCQPENPHVALDPAGPLHERWLLASVVWTSRNLPGYPPTLALTRLSQC